MSGRVWRRGTPVWLQAKVKLKATKTINPRPFSSSTRHPRPTFTITDRQFPPTPPPELQSDLHGGAMSLRVLLRLEAVYLGLITAALLLMTDCVT